MSKIKIKNKPAKKPKKFCEVEIRSRGQSSILRNINQGDTFDFIVDTRIEVPINGAMVSVKYESAKIKIDTVSKKVTIRKFNPPQFEVKR